MMIFFYFHYFKFFLITKLTHFNKINKIKLTHRLLNHIVCHILLSYSENWEKPGKLAVFSQQINPDSLRILEKLL